MLSDKILNEVQSVGFFVKLQDGLFMSYMPHGDPSASFVVHTSTRIPQSAVFDH